MVDWLMLKIEKKREKTLIIYKIIQTIFIKVIAMV